MRKTILFTVLAVAMAAAVAAQCPHSDCSPYLSESPRGVAYSGDDFGEGCMYSEGDDYDYCSTGREESNTWTFQNTSCIDASCTAECNLCSDDGTDCNFVELGDGTKTCNDGTCECPLPGFSESEAEIPEIGAIPIIIMLGVAALIGAVVLKKR